MKIKFLNDEEKIIKLIKENEYKIVENIDGEIKFMNMFIEAANKIKSTKNMFSLIKKRVKLMLNMTGFFVGATVVFYEDGSYSIYEFGSGLPIILQSNGKYEILS